MRDVGWVVCRIITKVLGGQRGCDRGYDQSENLDKKFHSCNPKEKFLYDTNKITFQYLDLIYLQRTKLPSVTAVGKSAKKNCL